MKKSKTTVERTKIPVKGPKVALVIEGGWYAWVCFCRNGMCHPPAQVYGDTIDVVYGSSASAVVGAFYFFSSGQPYYDQLTKTNGGT